MGRDYFKCNTQKNSEVYHAPEQNYPREPAHFFSCSLGYAPPQMGRVQVLRKSHARITRVVLFRGVVNLTIFLCIALEVVPRIFLPCLLGCAPSETWRFHAATTGARSL